MDIKQLIKQNFEQSIQTKQQVQAELEQPLADAVGLIVTAFKNGKKLLICGNGGSAADAQHLAAEFTGRFEIDRTPLPAIAFSTDSSALTAIGNDYGYDVVFSKQVEALGQAGDVLYAISTSGNSGNVIKAIEVAHAKGMPVIGVLGRDGGKIAQMLKAGDVNLCVSVNRTARVQEVHLLMLHTICDAVDTVMFK